MKQKFPRLDKKEFSEVAVLKTISLSTRKALIVSRTRVNVLPTRKGMAYTKENPKHKLWFEAGYSFLQYNIVVREYILRRYQIKKDIELDIMLYLMPFQFFTQEDFMVLPVRSKGYNMKKLIALGFIEKKVPRSKKAGAIYAVTPHSKRIVMDYYQYLSGEKVLKDDSYTNPFRDKEAKKVDRDREALMMKLATQVRTQPKKFKDSFS
jgi:hypothetical protein